MTTEHIADERECIEQMHRSEIIPRRPVAYMTTVEKSLGRPMTVMEAGEIYGAWQRAIPMEEIAATIRTRDNAADAGAAEGETAGSQGGRNAPAPQPNSFECPACHDPVRKPGLCASCDVFDSDEPDIAPMTGRVFFAGDALPDRFGGGE